MKINISITVIQCIIAFIGGMVFHHELYRWDKEPSEVIFCGLSFLLFISLPRIISLIYLHHTP